MASRIDVTLEGLHQLLKRIDRKQLGAGDWAVIAALVLMLIARTVARQARLKAKAAEQAAGQNESEPLSNERDALCAAAHPESDVLSALVDRALLAERALDRAFWLESLASAVNDASPDERDGRYYDAARCIHATFRAEPRRRQHAVRVLAERLVPLA